ncbi:hypothetical protein [Actinomadura chibensis]|uniref:tRNA nuclease CdiA C-terminal domain-containing protein n=1 Tax=Actinomadura chibensis TaxID=392828 RepID=A0A5D0NK69_9ACTN|nr:hypothetical protein [Actinomadura chibensis]TYB44853.1 hypothetical protein FXF69_22185 [Actinomadura chibensis]
MRFDRPSNSSDSDQNKGGEADERRLQFGGSTGKEAEAVRPQPQTRAEFRAELKVREERAGGHTEAQSERKDGTSERAIGRTDDKDETRLAELLAGEGKNVVARREGERRVSDAFVDGMPTEFKTIKGRKIPGAEEHEAPTYRTVKAALNSAKGQLKHDPVGNRTAILDSRGYGLAPEEAERGVRAYLGQPFAQDKISRIRIIGDGWGFDWP